MRIYYIVRYPILDVFKKMSLKHISYNDTYLIVTYPILDVFQENVAKAYIDIFFTYCDIFSSVTTSTFPSSE